MNYNASGGKEYFIAAESRDGKILYGFCRLRLPSRNTQHITRNIFDYAALVRELHVYGELVPVGKQAKVQHAGLGKKLLAAAENIAKENGHKHMAIISGVGVRGYYRRQGYRLKDTYMAKAL